MTPVQFVKVVAKLERALERKRKNIMNPYFAILRADPSVLDPSVLHPQWFFQGALLQKGFVLE